MNIYCTLMMSNQSHIKKEMFSTVALKMVTSHLTTVTPKTSIAADWFVLLWISHKDVALRLQERLLNDGVISGQASCFM